MTVGTPLVYVETRLGEASPGCLGLLGRARWLTGGAAAVVCGPDAGSVADTLARHGADEIWVAEDTLLDPQLPAPLVDALSQVVAEGGYSTVLFENSVVAAEAASALSARLEAGVNWDLLDIDVQGSELVGKRRIFGDTVEVQVGWVGEPRLAVFRLGSFEPVEAAAQGTMRHVAPVFGDRATATRVVDRVPAFREGVALTSAEVIVAGGRGVRDRQSLVLLEDLAAALGGAVGVSMPLVDRGWYPATAQVGQTGNKVRPRLYLACGISGSLAHRVGMEKSGTIVAINSDPAAAIFGICDAGVVGDLHQIVPELTRLVLERRTGAGGAVGSAESS